MQYNNYVVQDFDEDLENYQGYQGYQGDEGYTRSVPTIYREVYTTNERLDFQNPNQPQRPAFGFRSDQQIEFKNTAKRNYQSEKGSRSKSKKKVAFSLPRKKKTTKFAPGKKKKTMKAYAKQAVVKKQQEPLQENRDWNMDTRTTGYFDKSLRRQVISHPMRDNLVKGKEIVDERDRSEGNRGRQMRATAKPVYEEGKKDYYTDLYEFADRVSQMRTSPPRTAQGEAPKSAKKYSPRGEQPKKSAMKARTYSNPNLKQIAAEDVVQTMVRDQEDARGKANPVFVRKAREMLEGKGNKNKFFVSMSVKRERLFVPRVRKNPKFSHVVAKLMHPTASTRSKMNTEPLEERQLRSKSPMEKVYKQDRLEQQQRIYLNGQGGQDMYPTREDGGYNMRDVRSYSEKQRAMSNYQEPVRRSYPTNQQEMYDQQYMYDQQQQQQNQQYMYDQQQQQQNQRFYDPNQQMYDQQMYNQRYEDQNRYYQQQEIAKRVEADYMLDEYRNRLQERAQEPNVYFDRISRGLENLRQDFGAVSQNLQQTSAYMNKYNKKQTGSYQIAAKGAGKLINLYSEQLTELLLDDLIFETIPILHEKEENEKKLMRNRKKKEMLQTCLEAFKDLTHEHQRVHERAEEIYTLTTMTKNRMKTLERDTYTGTVPKKVLKKKIELGQPQVNVVKEYKEKFKNLKKTNELFSEKSHIMMDIIVRDMLDDLTRDVIGKVVEAQNELVERMFISEFDF